MESPMLSRALRICLASSLVAAFFAVAGRAPAVESLLEKSWPTFRGAARTANSPDTGLLETWPEEGPKLVWKAVGAGAGYSSLAIAGGKVITLGDKPSTVDDDDEYLVCFNQADGKPLWKTKTGAAWNQGAPEW